MIYFEFINKTKKYLKSVRSIKDYISFDLIFPDTWVIHKSYYDELEIIKNNNIEQGSITLSFVSQINEEGISKIESTIDKIIKFNIEREEKELLFRNKVKELKNIFESNKLDNLKSLKFDVDHINELISEDNTNDGQENTERDRELQDTETEKSL